MAVTSEAGTGKRVLDDRYELGELVGSGGMAEVWRARDTKLGRDVAVKILSGPSARDASMRRRIEREARALAALGHPNVVAVYDYGESEDPSGEVRPYVVMELVDGPDLHRYLESNGPLPADEATGILRAVLGAVERAHAAGIVHGDLKPANVILSSRGPKVGDFGVARILAEETGTTTVAATPSFAAPEVLRGERPTETSDVYSAACMGFEMLTGRLPYEGANAWEVAAKHLEDPVPHVRHFSADVPHRLNDAILRSMAKNPKRRHGSARDLADAIVTAPATTPVSPATLMAARTPEATEALPNRPDLAHAALFGSLAGWRERLGGRVRTIFLAAVLVAVIALLGALVLSDGGPELVEVPDVRGLTSAAAAAQLRMGGFAADVSFRPVTTGSPDVVLETIPAMGARVEPGTKVHVIASALASTPQPTEPDEGRGKDKGRGRPRDD